MTDPMTDRVAAFLVTLDEDRREDDIEAIMTALGMVRGVVKVEPMWELRIAEERARVGLGQRQTVKQRWRIRAGLPKAVSDAS